MAETAQVYDYEHDPNGLIPTIDKYSRYRKTESGYIFKGPAGQPLLATLVRSGEDLGRTGGSLLL